LDTSVSEFTFNHLLYRKGCVHLQDMGGAWECRRVLVDEGGLDLEVDHYRDNVMT